MSLTQLALLDGRRPLPLGDVIGLTLTVTFISWYGRSKTIQNSVCINGIMDRFEENDSLIQSMA
jgi:hypothetical protein